MPVFKVYISSTYVDLKEYRKTVREFFNKFRDKFEVISMEDYVAESEIPAAKCIDDVRKCDFYILILANRYGFIPENSASYANPGQLSVTHAEFEAAKQSGKKIFAFFGDHTAGFEPDTDTDPVLLQTKQDKLHQLKKEIKNNYLTHPENFNSVFQLALMVAESMMKAGEKYADLLLSNARQLIERYIHQDRIYCLNRITQFNRYLNSRIEGKSPFKAIFIHGTTDTLVESLQKRIMEITLNIPKSSVYKTSFNGIFGTGTMDYEEAKRIFLHAAFQQFFATSEKAAEIENFRDLAGFLNNQPEKTRIAFVINWTKLLNKDADPRTAFLEKILKEIYEACCETNCRNIYLFLNISYKPADEAAFKTIIQGICTASSPEKRFAFALEQLQPVLCEDLGLWIESYVTEIPSKKNRIIREYLAELDDEFSMQQAEEKMYDFISKVNNKDPQALQILT